MPILMLRNMIETMGHYKRLWNPVAWSFGWSFRRWSFCWRLSDEVWWRKEVGNDLYQSSMRFGYCKAKPHGNRNPKTNIFMWDAAGCCRKSRNTIEWVSFFIKSDLKRRSFLMVSRCCNIAKVVGIIFLIALAIEHRRCILSNHFKRPDSCFG